jgi:hypothetical protein
LVSGRLKKNYIYMKSLLGKGWEAVPDKRVRK